MKPTKQQLNRIIKEELQRVIEGARIGGIDEFAKKYGVTRLPHTFKTRELVEFVYELLDKTEGKFQSGVHPLTVPLDPEDDKSGVGFALEKLLQNRIRTAPRHPDVLELHKDYRRDAFKDIQQELIDALDELLDAVSPAGHAKSRAQTARERTADRKAGWNPQND